MAFTLEIILNPKLLERIQKSKEQAAIPIHYQEFDDLIRNSKKSQIQWNKSSLLDFSTQLTQSKINLPSFLYLYLTKENIHVFQYENIFKFEINKAKTIYLTLPSISFLGPIRRVEIESLFQEDLFLSYKDEFNQIFLYYKEKIYRILD